MIGTWNSTQNVTVNKTGVVTTIVIDSIAGENFFGKRIKELTNHDHSRIVISVSGYFDKQQLYIQPGIVLFKKEPPNGQWWDCSSCTPDNKITIQQDKILLTQRISGCQQNCDGVFTYYRPLCDYDTTMQRYLVDLFGTASDIAFYKPCIKPPEIIASDPDQNKVTKDSLNNAAALAKKRQKQIDDSTKNAIALAKRRAQFVSDSIAVSKIKEQQRTKDSLQDAAAYIKKRQKEIADSTALLERRQRQSDDSLATVAAIEKQKEQQRIQDSINNAALLAKQRQKQIDDSIILVKKRQKQFDDSLATVAAIAKQQEQKRIQDSINNAALLAKQRQKQIDDSTKNAIALAKQRQQQIDDSIALIKKRQKQIDDSLVTVAAIAKQQEQKRIQDSINNAALLAKQRQRQIDDSTKSAIALAKQRQQQIDDSIILVKKRQKQVSDSLATVAAIARQKEQKRIQDSLDNAALLAKARQKFIDDSTQNAIALAKQKKQYIDDSIKVAKQKQQKHMQDSISNASLLAKARQKQMDDSMAVVQRRQQQINDSINLAKQKEQMRIQDSINRVAANTNKKTIVGKDTVKNSTINAFETRDNVLLQTYHIPTPDILIELFDNAEIDGDRVSVYHNNTLIVNNQMLVRDPITFKIHADSTNRMHEFILIAENLGTIPPNTALMRVTVGTQVYKLSVKTDLKTNAKIVFYYDGN
ncbi:MAG: hypothetical protein JO072_15150 [Parafilimonas sp.]|nr:hypothetical protein [Parafilimonas sp.]